ncbi:unnamed protein product [Adineta steineri]|uniref:VOC domain-containing protein n=1 Tax=Adineta steineri TaxID=433720 RepID=A0A815JBS9_9BILA|nr:unnamed protein product [Adineta steineri]CAF1374633.1 unnamed protein product [Adineta steineri]
MDVSNYSGPYLPGFMPMAVDSHQWQQFNESIASNIDHLAIALPRQSIQLTMSWYERVLGLTRLLINREDDPFQGFAVRVGSIGMRMFAGLYWKCAETGCVDVSKKFKLVFVESLIDDDSNATDQITTFIKNHNDQGGIQHMAFTCVNNIKHAVRTAKVHGAEFLTPCVDYYLQENNGTVIESAGESAADLSELGILLDDEADDDNTQGTTSTVAETKRVLLQIFTTSLFNNYTFFLELIERRGANGFGSGNVRTLWKIVQQRIDRNT